MADDTNFPDEEYHFSDIEADEEAFDTSSSARTGGRQDIRKRVFIAIGTIILVLAVYKLLGVFFTEKKTKKQPAQAVVTQSVVPQPRIEQPRPSIEMTRSLTQLQQKITENTGTISNLTSRVSALQGALDRANQSMTTMDTQLKAINQKLDELMKPKVKVIPKAKKRIRKRRPWVKPTVYYIKAIIPGRAWLKTEKGATLTIIEGKSLRGYGRITKIDPQQGLVVTSSGRKIRFSPDER